MHLKWTFFREAASQWSKHNAPRLGAALAYYTVLSMAPLLVVVVAVCGLVFGAEAVRGQIYWETDRESPAGSNVLLANRFDHEPPQLRRQDRTPRPRRRAAEPSTAQCSKPGPPRGAGHCAWTIDWRLHGEGPFPVHAVNLSKQLRCHREAVGGMRGMMLIPDIQNLYNHCAVRRDSLAHNVDASQGAGGSFGGPASCQSGTFSA